MSVLSKVDYSVVLPCLNEELTISECIRIAFESASNAGHLIEVIVADNGSIDSSVEKALSAGARIVNVPVRGYGAALDAGIRSANSEYVIIADADLSYDLSSAKDFYLSMRNNGYDLVVGNRFKGGISKGAMPKLHRYLGNPVLSAIARTFFSVPLGDFHCGIRGIRKTKYMQANPKTKGMEFATEMVLRFVEADAKISEIETTLVPDGRDRKPHLRSFPDGWRHLKLMLLFAPQFFLMLPGLFMIFTGSLFLGEYLLTERIDLIFATTDIQGGFISMVIVVIGAQLFTAGAVSIAFAKTKGISRFKWATINYQRHRAVISTLVPVLLILIGIIFFIKVFLDWNGHKYGHLNPISESRFSFIGGAFILSGVTTFIGAIQVRQIISKFW